MVEHLSVAKLCTCMLVLEVSDIFAHPTSKRATVTLRLSRKATVDLRESQSGRAHTDNAALQPA